MIYGEIAAVIVLAAILIIIVVVSVIPHYIRVEGVCGREQGEQVSVIMLSCNNHVLPASVQYRGIQTQTQTVGRISAYQRQKTTSSG